MGMALKHWHLTSTDFLKTADRLVYFIFFPALLFWKIGGSPPSPTSTDNSIWRSPWRFYASTWVPCLYLLAGTSVSGGTFSQNCYRFNTYIGMAIVINALGEERRTALRDFDRISDPHEQCPGGLRP